MDVKAPSGSPNRGGSNAQPSRKQNAGNNKDIVKIEADALRSLIKSQGRWAKELKENRTIKTHSNVTR